MRKRFLMMSILLGGVGLAWAGVPSKVTRRGWKPLVTLAGQGEEQEAISGLRRGSNTVGTVLHGLEMDEQTEEFITEVRASLASFDLEEYYERLPDQQGPWRRIRVTGKKVGNKYVVKQAAHDQNCTVSPHGPIGTQPGDLGVELSARPVKRPERESYQIRIQAGVGVGKLNWQDVTGWMEETTRLAATGDIRAPGATTDRQYRPSTRTRLKLVKLRPKLRKEEIEILGVMWEAFPEMGDLLVKVMRIEDVIAYDPKGDGSYQHLRFSARLRPDLLKNEYPELAEFLEGMGPLLNLQSVWQDDQGRQIARVSLDSKTLRFVVECFVRDGRILPVSKYNGQVVVDEPVDPNPTKPKRYTTLTNLKFNMNGLRLGINGLRMDWRYSTGERRANLGFSVTKVPQVTVSGRAYGVLPSWAIDVMIPGNIGDLTREFMETACKGNGGKGITFDMRSRQRRDGPGTLVAKAQVEVLDSSLVAFGARIASLKLIPSDDVRADIRKLLIAIHGAFVKDLNRFERLTKRG